MDLIIDLLKKFNLVPVPLLDGQMQVVKAKAILEANWAGVFHALEKQPGGMTYQEVASATGLSVEGSKVLLRALVSAGYLHDRSGRYVNGSWPKRWIVDPQRSLTNMLKLQMFTYRRLDRLGENLRNGCPPLDIHQLAVAEPTPQQEVYTRAMREAARLIIPDLMKRVRLPAGPKRFLDIGGAHGEYCRAFVRRYPGLKATVMDLAGPVSTAKAIMKEEGNAEGLELTVGDCLHDDLGSGWDVILLANMVHLFDHEQNLTLFKSCAKALRPGGKLLCVDQFVGISGRRDRLFGLISLNFFNVGGKSYDIVEMRELLAKAGLDQVEVRPLGLRTPASLIQATATGAALAAPAAATAIGA